MLPTQFLGSLKGFFPRVHQPLPLNQRERQRFLKALTSSFRKHLDKEHGWLHDDIAPSNPNLPARESLPHARPSKDTHRRPTDRHLRAILSNPLFSYDTALAQQTGSPAAPRDPLDIFDEAVARGLMTPARAAGCLMAKRREIVRSPTLSVQEAMGACGAGLKVVQWLQSSGLERDLSFVADRGLTRLLLLFIVAEGLEDIAWEWIERLVQAEGPAAASPMLDRLVAAKAAGASNLDEGYSTLVTAVDKLKAYPTLEPILLPWRHLAWLSTVEAWRRASPSVALYEGFLELGERLRVPAKGLERAHLDLHHPTQPSSAQAIQVLHRDTLWRNAEAATSKAVKRFALKIMSMGLDTAQHLTQTGKSEEAQEILDLLNLKFSQHFPRSEMPQFPGVLAAG